MAFDHDGFFAVVGKTVKLVNQADGYIDAIESRKIEIRDILDTEGLLDLYITVPPIISAMQDNVTAWIQTLISNLNSLITNRPYVIEQLVVSSYTVTDIWNAIFDYMEENSETIKSSVVTIGGSDVNENASFDVADLEISPVVLSDAVLFATRILDGVSNPGNGVIAHKRYQGIEGQLARTTTMYARVETNTAGSETATLFSSAELTGPYVLEDEEPGAGTNLSTAQTNNAVGANFDFSSWTGDSPNSWAVLGGVAGTDWKDYSTTGLGPLQVVTTGVEVSKQITGLVRNKMYFVAVAARVSDSDDPNAAEFSVRIRNLNDDHDYMTARSTEVEVGDTEDANKKGIAYGFFSLEDDDDPSNVYIELKLVTALGASAGTRTFTFDRVVLCEALYYNGLGLAWWPYNATSALPVPVGYTVSLATANNDGGVLQSFIRKAYNIQLPTADSPTILDSLAT